MNLWKIEYITIEKIQQNWGYDKATKKTQRLHFIFRQNWNTTPGYTCSSISCSWRGLALESMSMETSLPRLLDSSCISTELPGRSYTDWLWKQEIRYVWISMFTPKTNKQKRYMLECPIYSNIAHIFACFDTEKHRLTVGKKRRCRHWCLRELFSSAALLLQILCKDTMKYSNWGHIKAFRITAVKYMRY